MTGTLDYPLSEQIADTIAVHGREWAAHYYIVRRRVPAHQYMLLTYWLNFTD